MSTTRFRRPNLATTAVALALVGTFALTGCSTDAEAVAEPAPTATTAAEADDGTAGGNDAGTDAAPEHAETEPPLPVVNAGDIVTPEKAATLTSPQMAYELADGRLMVVDRKQPLPEPVMAEIQQLRNETVVTVFKSGVEEATTLEVPNFINEVGNLTGKNAVVVYAYAAAPYCKGGTGLRAYAAKGPSDKYMITGECAAFPTPEEAYADAVEAIRIQGEIGLIKPETYVVIPYQG